jgi:hypothetical protein
MFIDLPRLIRADAGVCRYINRANRSAIGATFAIISRLGDGVFWYTLMAVMVILPGGETRMVTTPEALQEAVLPSPAKS